MDIHVTKDEPGPHDGWRNQHFTYLKSEWRLLTIDETANPRIAKPRQSSAIIEERNLEHPHAQKMRTFHFDGIITPDAAAHILALIEHSHQFGHAQGRREAQAEMRKAIGL